MATAHMVSFLPFDYRISNFRNFAAALADAGVRVRTIELDGYENRFQRIEGKGVERLLLPFGREHMSLPLRLVRRLLRYLYFALGAILLRLRWRPGDVVIANDLWSLFLVSLAVPLERVVYYEVEIPLHKDAHTPFFERYLRRFALANVKRCLCLISVERNRLRFLSKLYRQPRTMVVLNAQSRREVPADVSRHLPARPRLVYAGRLMGQTLSPLLFAFIEKYHALYEIDLFGTPEEDSCRAPYERVRNLPGVTAHGFAPRAVLEEALDRANVSIVLWDPNDLSHIGLRYCAPHKFFEAAARQLPVVCSPNPPLREWLGQYRVGEVIEPLTVDGLQAAVARVLDPANYEGYRREGSRAFDEAWNFERQIQPVIDRLREYSAELAAGGREDGGPTGGRTP